MKNLFVRVSNYSGKEHPENVRVPLDIANSAAILKEKGHEVEVVDMKAEKVDRKEIEKVLDKEFENVFIKTQTPSKRIAEDLADLSKDSRVFFFGQHPTVSPRTILERDLPEEYCVGGEIEKVLMDIVEGEGISEDFIKNSSILSEKGKTFEKIAKVEDLDKLPLPDYSIFKADYGDILPLDINHSKADYGYLETSRGCPYNCIYCSPTLRVSYGKRMRYKSAEKVVDEMERLVEKGHNVLVFKDDIFTISETHVEKICKEISKRDIKVPWFAQTRADTVSEKLFKKMKKAGCKAIGIGVESGSERILDILKKGEGKQEVRKAFETAKKAGISTVGFFMLGNPTETLEEMKETLNFCLELQPDMVQVAFFTPYPGSRAYEIYGQKMEDDFSDFHHYNHVTFNPSKVSNSHLTYFQKKFYIRFFISKGFLKGLMIRKLHNPLDFSIEKMYLKKGVKFLLD